MTKEKIYWARICNYTGKGMNTGYVFCDDSCMIDDRELFIKEIRQDREAIMNYVPEKIEDLFEYMKRYDNPSNYTDKELQELSVKINKARNNKETDEELCDIAYAVDYYYWTDWEEDYEYVEINGKIYDLP